MPKYRKRPVTVEAFQYWPDKPLPEGVYANNHQYAPGKHYVITIHRQHAYLQPGNWVITESDGKHHYPCAAEEFERIYEPVENSPDPPLAP